MLRSSLFPRRHLCFFNADPGGTPGNPAPVAETPPAKPLSIGEQLRAAITTKANLQRDLDASRAELTEAGETISTLTADNARLTDEVATSAAAVGTLTTDLSAAKEKIAALEAAKTTVSAAVVETVAAAGFPAAALPPEQKAVAGDTDAQIKDLQAKMEGASPTEKFKLSTQIKALRHPAKKAA